MHRTLWVHSVKHPLTVVWGSFRGSDREPSFNLLCGSRSRNLPFTPCSTAWVPRGSVLLGKLRPPPISPSAPHWSEVRNRKSSPPASGLGELHVLIYSSVCLRPSSRCLCTPSLSGSFKAESECCFLRRVFLAFFHMQREKPAPSRSLLLPEGSFHLDLKSTLQDFSSNHKSDSLRRGFMSPGVCFLVPGTSSGLKQQNHNNNNSNSNHNYSTASP